MEGGTASLKTFHIYSGACGLVISTTYAILKAWIARSYPFQGKPVSENDYHALSRRLLVPEPLYTLEYNLHSFKLMKIPVP